MKHTLAAYAYFYMPFLAWGAAWVSKLIINTLRAGKFSLAHVTHGGMPSNHATITSSMTALIFMREGFHPAFGVAMMITLIVCMDAHTLRRQVGFHAQAINTLKPDAHLRERLGHTYPQIFAGVALGIALAYVVTWLGA